MRRHGDVVGGEMKGDSKGGDTLRAALIEFLDNTFAEYPDQDDPSRRALMIVEAIYEVGAEIVDSIEKHARLTRR